MLHVALWTPEIPPNTGNVARTCAAAGVRLHLIGPLGFRVNDRQLKRAGLDYWPAVDLRTYDDGDQFLSQFTGRIVVVETGAGQVYTRQRYRDGDCLLFGSESAGLPASVRERYAADAVRVPMPTGAVRSLNLATTVGIVAYEALRQLHDW